MIFPFLFELRTVLDWMFVKTSLTFFEWIRVESIFAQVFAIKSKRMRARNANPRGIKMQTWKKILLGGGITALLIGVIWFPLVLFAVSSSLGTPNNPREVNVHFQFGIYEPIYKATVMQAEIHQFTSEEWKKFSGLYEKYLPAKSFLQDYEANDLVAMHFSRNSSTLWGASPPNSELLIAALKDDGSISVRFEYKIWRNNFGDYGREALQGETEYKIEDQKIKESLIRMLTNPNEAEPVVIPSIFPKIMLMRNKGRFENIEELLSGKTEKFHKNVK